MTCDEFQLAALDLDTPGPKGPLQQAAREHLRECANCAALHSNWQELRGELGALGSEDMDLQTPSRVEMRLRQEFRTKHKTLKARRNAVDCHLGLGGSGGFGRSDWVDQLESREKWPIGAAADDTLGADGFKRDDQCEGGACCWSGIGRSFGGVEQS